MSTPSGRAQTRKSTLESICLRYTLAQHAFCRFLGAYDIPFLPTLLERYVPSFLYAEEKELIARHRRVEELAKRKGVSMAQISTAWIMARPGVTAPIVGTTSLKNLEDILGA